MQKGTYVERLTSWLPADEREHPDVVRLLRSKSLAPFELDDRDGVPPHNAVFELPGVVSSAAAARATGGTHLWTLAGLVKFLTKVYCSSVGVEFSHLESDKQRVWLQEKVEEMGDWKLPDKESKLKVLEQLMRVEYTASFLTRTFPSSKVFGLEGSEGVVVGINALLETGSRLGVEAVEVGMAHRGRMNVLHNCFGKPLHAICATFNESDLSELGDVKYHLGTRAQLRFADRVLHVSLAANPSHLEAVCPVVIGKCKATQFFLEDTEKKMVCPLLLHGDASFAGQGIVPETLELSNLPNYTVGGCVHVVINNQIGFTTDPRSARTSFHCTNMAKVSAAPIIHVNCDDVEAVAKVCQLAMEFRQTFGRDIVVDLIGYRRHGHNSLDDPSITQPLTYKLIKDHPTSIQIYSSKLISEGILTRAELDAMTEQIREGYARQLSDNANYLPDALEWLASNWQGAAIGSMISTRPYNQTGVRMSRLHRIGKALCSVPAGFQVHKDVAKLLESRAKMLESGQGVTMAFAEALAFGTLMSKFSPGTKVGLTAEERTVASAQVPRSALDIQLQEHPCVHVRLSGQDVVRGTFNQRHAEIYCQQTGRAFSQLNNLGLEQATISVCNSSLSEAAVLGFEYGQLPFPFYLLGLLFSALF